MTDKLAILDKAQALKIVSGNEKLANELLTMLIKDLPMQKQSIQTQFNSGNREELRKVVHKLHGGLRYVGAPALLAIVSETDKCLFDLTDEQLVENLELIYENIDLLIKAQTYE